MKKLLNIVGAVAPTLGTALGGPLGGMASGVISKVLGVDNNQQAIERAIQSATPEQLLEIKKAEKEIEVKMQELQVDVFKLETQDKQDARSKFGTLQPPEQNSEALINLVLGYLGGLASAVISFYFGASHKDQDTH